MSGPRWAELRPEPLFEREFLLGEGPLWDEQRQRLYWTDIDAGHVFGAALEDAAPELLYTGPKVGGFTLETDGSLVLFRETDVARLDPNDRSVTPMWSLEGVGRERFNDVEALPDGSVLAGVIAAKGEPGLLWRVRPGGAAAPVFDCESSIGNGIAIDRSRGVLYWTDTPGRRILRFALGDHGELGKPSEWRCVPDRSGEGHPDGLTCDAEGMLYSARWDGSRVAILRPSDGEEVGSIRLPVRNVTSAAFCGSSMSTLAISTAGGPLFAVELPTSGRPPYRSRLTGD